MFSVHLFPLQVHLKQLAVDQKSAYGSVWFAFVFQCDEAHGLTNARLVLSPGLPLLPLGCLSLSLTVKSLVRETSLRRSQSSLHVLVLGMEI